MLSIVTEPTAAGKHRLGDDAADRDLAEPRLGGLVAVDLDREVRLRDGEVALGLSRHVEVLDVGEQLARSRRRACRHPLP